MREGLEKKLMLDLLTHPAEVIYKDEHIAVLKPDGNESLGYHLSRGQGKFNFMNNLGQTLRVRNNDVAYVVATWKKERFIVLETDTGWKQRDLRFEYAGLTPTKLVKKYPSLLDAFDKIATKIACLVLVKDQTEDVIKRALKYNPSHIRYVRKLTFEDKKRWIEYNPDVFEYMPQDKRLVEYAMDNTDVGLGKISSHFCTASICKKGIRKNPRDLKYVPTEHKTDEMAIYAIQRDPSVLSSITHPTTEMYVAAVKAGKNGWDYVPEGMKKKVKKLI